MSKWFLVSLLGLVSAGSFSCSRQPTEPSVVSSSSSPKTKGEQFVEAFRSAVNDGDVTDPAQKKHALSALKSWTDQQEYFPQAFERVFKTACEDLDEYKTVADKSLQAGKDAYNANQEAGSTTRLEEYIFYYQAEFKAAESIGCSLTSDSTPPAATADRAIAPEPQVEPSSSASSPSASSQSSNPAFNAEIFEPPTNCRAGAGKEYAVTTVFPRGVVSVDASNPKNNGGLWYREVYKNCWVHESQLRWLPNKEPAN